MDGKATTATAGAERDQLANWMKDASIGFAGDVLKFSGEVHFKSMLRIDGKFSGQIHSAQGTLIISSGALITDVSINVAVARINGTVSGEISASKELILGRTARVNGAISAAALVVEEGALFDGSVRKI